jgi:hypothetical protein
MDPTTTFCPNEPCPARGQTGMGNITFPRIPTEMPFQAVFMRGRVQAPPA